MVRGKLTWNFGHMLHSWICLKMFIIIFFQYNFKDFLVIFSLTAICALSRFLCNSCKSDIRDVFFKTQSRLTRYQKPFEIKCVSRCFKPSFSKASSSVFCLRSFMFCSRSFVRYDIAFFLNDVDCWVFLEAFTINFVLPDALLCVLWICLKKSSANV